MNIPEKMQCIEITRPGGPEVLAPSLRKVPIPKGNEVLIKVAAAGVNRPDCLQRKGVYPPPAGETDIPGLEVSGKIVSNVSKILPNILFIPIFSHLCNTVSQESPPTCPTKTLQ